VSLCYSLHEAFAPWVMAGKQAVIDEVRREQFVKRLQVSLGLRLQEAAHQGLVLLFGRHGVCSLLPSCAMKPSYPRSCIRCLTQKEYSRLIHPSARKGILRSSAEHARLASCSSRASLKQGGHLL
jgi:hypothetical protein